MAQATDMPGDQLNRATVHEPSRDYPQELRIVAKWANNKTKTIVIPAGEYYGTGAYGAPMNGERLMQRIGLLLRDKPV